MRLVAAVVVLAGSAVEATHDDEAFCEASCYGASCDYWDGGAWGSCSHLESRWGCDCFGCACDGCPQGSCAEPKFDPFRCPLAGDGTCDRSMNTEACAFDGGDCCASTCQGVVCGSRGFDCADPEAPARRDEEAMGPASAGGSMKLSVVILGLMSVAIVGAVPATLAALSCYKRRLARVRQAQRFQEELRQQKINAAALETAALVVKEVAKKRAGKG